MVFPYSPNIEERSIRSFLDQGPGVKELSVLYGILDNFPKGITIDIMHTVYRGPVEDDMKKLIKGFRRNVEERLLIRLSQQGLTNLDESLSKFVQFFQKIFCIIMRI